MLLGVTLPIVVLEVLAYACLGLCIWHALHQGPLRRARLIELSIGVLYGLTLEILTIAQLHSYQYGRFLIMLGPVPLAVAVGWGIILYSAMAFADSLAFPSWAAPALVGLLGLNIDLTMDAVAIRLNMWHWLDYKGNQEWFGVPYANFYSWFIVLCSCSALLWLVRPLTVRPGWRGPLAALGALLGSVVILILLDELVVQYDHHGGIVWLPVVIVVSGAFVVVGRGLWVMRMVARPSAREAPMNVLIPSIVPFYFHFFFFSMLFVAGIAAHLPALVAISLVMMAVSLVLHGWLLQQKLVMRQFPSEQSALSSETFGEKEMPP
ncbi:MAG TPA: carotenoid biosynthesis protein [Ktedonobacteraceae bacterium]